MRIKKFNESDKSSKILIKEDIEDLLIEFEDLKCDIKIEDLNTCFKATISYSSNNKNWMDRNDSNVISKENIEMQIDILKALNNLYTHLTMMNITYRIEAKSHMNSDVAFNQRDKERIFIPINNELLINIIFFKQIDLV